MEEERKRQPKWQRARYQGKQFKPHDFWTACEPPTMNAGVDPFSKRQNRSRPCYTSNVRCDCGCPGTLRVSAAAVELLPIFADEVEIEPFEEWRARAVKSVGGGNEVKPKQKEDN